MALNLLEKLQSAIYGQYTWPPPDINPHWEKVRDYRRRYTGLDEEGYSNIRYATSISRLANGRDIYTPAALTREIGHFSAAMLFSSVPSITFEDNPDLLDSVLENNTIESRAIEAAARIAIEGRGAWRVHWDEEIADVPLIHYVPEDQVLWEERYGDVVLGGAVVVERRPDRAKTIVYRLIEIHSIGSIDLTLYRGTNSSLGNQVDLGELEEFATLEEHIDTGLDSPTLYRWNNKPGGESDLAGIEGMLDRYDEGWSYLVDKMQKSVPVSFAPASLFDDKGSVDLSGVIPLRQGRVRELEGEDPSRQFGTVQPDLQAQEHIEILDRMRQEILMDAGYALTSYGIEQQGTATSGTALRLMQSRTIQTKNAKEWEATEALTNALACAMCWADSGSTVKDYRPEVKLADAMPRDETEVAATSAAWDSQGAISLEEKVRQRRPDWDDDAVQKEVKSIKAENPAPAPGVPQLDLGFGRSEPRDENE